MYRTEPPTDKTIREWYMKFQQSGRSVNEDCDPGDSVPAKAAAGILLREDVCAECAKHLTETSAIPNSRDLLTSEGS